MNRMVALPALLSMVVCSSAAEAASRPHAVSEAVQVHPAEVRQVDTVMVRPRSERASPPITASSGKDWNSMWDWTFEHKSRSFKRDTDRDEGRPYTRLWLPLVSRTLFYIQGAVERQQIPQKSITIFEAGHSHTVRDKPESQPTIHIVAWYHDFDPGSEGAIASVGPVDCYCLILDGDGSGWIGRDGGWIAADLAPEFCGSLAEAVGAKDWIDRFRSGAAPAEDYK